MTAVVGAIGQLLEDAGVGDYTAPDELLDPAKTPITVASMPADGDLAVVLNTYPGGPEPDSANGWEYPRLQVRVRARNPLDALDLDRACYLALQGLSGDLPDTGLTLQDCYALQSEAQPLGADTNGRQEFVRNYQLSLEAG